MARARNNSRSANRMRNRGLLTQLLGRPERGNWRLLLGFLIRARAEITVVIMIVTGYIVGVQMTDWSGQTVLITETVVIGLLVCLPGTRAQIWAVISRHRVWRCMDQTRTMTPNGTLPYLLWSSPSPIGERIRVFLPAGLSYSDLDHITEALAAACFAAEARVEVSRRFTCLATIHIARRDPFTGKRLTPRFHTNPDTNGNGGPLELPARDTVPTPTPPAQHPTVLGARAHATNRANGNGRRHGAGQPNTAGSNRETSKTTTNEPASSDTAASVGVGGMDVSDYV